MPCFIKDNIDNRISTGRIACRQHLLGNFDQIGIQASLVPLAENFSDLRSRHAQTIAQDTVNFSDHLHIGIFDAIVDGLHKMARAIFAKPRDAWFIIKFRSNRLQNGLDAIVRFLCAADHDRRTIPRAFFTTGNTHANEGQTAVFEALKTTHRIAEVCIPRIDHNIAVGQMTSKCIHLLINGFTRLDHDDDRAWRTNGSDEFFDCFAWDNLALKLTRIRIKLACSFNSTIKHSDAIAFLGNVQRQIRPHNAEADQAYFSLRHRNSPFSILVPKNARAWLRKPLTPSCIRNLAELS